MTQRRSPWRLAIACVFMALAAAGCFQEVGDTPQTTQVSAFIPTMTFTPEPPTEIPTETPTVEVVEQAATEEIAMVPTETSTPTPTETEMPTSTPTPSPEATELVAIDQNISEVSTKVAQAEEQDEFVLTATQYILEITQTVSFGETQTAIANGIGVITDTPFPTPTSEIPIFTTATPDPGTGITQPVNPGGVCVHEVRAGENLFRLSMTYGVSVADLASASGITNPQLILVGQKINVPGCGTTGVFPPPTSLPTTAFDASAQFGTGGSTLTGQTVQVQLADGQIVEGQLLNGGQGGGATFTGTTHVVQQYETLFQISQQYGVSVNSIAAANGITNINVIIMGDTLVIPAQ